MRKLIIGSLLALTTCGQTPTQTAADFACAMDATGAIVSVVNTVQAPTMTTTQKALNSVGTLSAVALTDPACAAVIAAMQKK